MKTRKPKQQESKTTKKACNIEAGLVQVVPLGVFYPLRPPSSCPSAPTCWCALRTTRPHLPYLPPPSPHISQEPNGTGRSWFIHASLVVSCQEQQNTRAKKKKKQNSNCRNKVRRGNESFRSPAKKNRKKRHAQKSPPTPSLPLLPTRMRSNNATSSNSFVSIDPHRHSSPGETTACTPSPIPLHTKPAVGATKAATPDHGFSHDTAGVSRQREEARCRASEVA